MSWIKPAFDDISGEREQQTMDPHLVGSERESSGGIWCDEYEPHEKGNLAVNHRKIEEVETWLRNAFNGRFGRAPIALISGPSGSGKTATVKVLSKCMDFSIREWITPGKVAIVKEEYEDSGMVWYESQVAQFEEYLFRASRYPSLMMPAGNCKFIVLVEDIPNVYINDTTLLEKTLQKYSEFGFCPMIFICSTGPTEFNLERMIFKDKLINELKISKISFNPATKKLLYNALRRIVHEGRKKNANLFQKVTEKFIHEVVEISNCDIRSAINQFQYLICGRTVVPKRKAEITHGKGIPSKRKAEMTALKAAPSKKKARITDVKASTSKDMPENTDVKAALSGGRDEFHDVFRYLGRVLYCKRVKVVDKDGVSKEKFLYNPDEIVGSVSSVPSLFLNLLNENYVSIFSDMKNIAEATDYLTYSDVLMSKWRERDLEIYYSLYLSVLGLMKCSNIGIKKTWLPLRSSKIKHAMAACKDKMNKCISYFPEKVSERRILMNELLPYYAKMDLSDVEGDKKKFIKSFSGWKSSGFRFSAADDSDIVEDVIESTEPSPSGFGGNMCVVKDVKALTNVTHDPSKIRFEIYYRKRGGRLTSLTPPQEEEEDAYIDSDSN